MYLNVFSVLTAVYVSLALSTDEQSCMVPVSDPSAIFNQDGATSATTGISEWKGETDQACNAKCCQSEECTVAVYEAAQQQADSRCQLYACRPLKSCSIHLGDGVAVFIRQVDSSATTLRADVTSQSDATSVSTDAATPPVATTTSHGDITLSNSNTTPSYGETSIPIVETATPPINSTPPPQNVTTTSPIEATIATTPQSLDGTVSQSSTEPQSADSTTPGSTSTSIEASTAKDVLDLNDGKPLPTESINSNSATQGEPQSLASQSQIVDIDTLTPSGTTVTPAQGPTEAIVPTTLQPLTDLTNATVSQVTTATATSFSVSTPTDHNSSVALSTTDANAATTPSALSAAPGSSPDAVNQTQQPAPASSTDEPSPAVPIDTPTSAESTPAKIQLNITEAVHVDAVTTAGALQNSTATTNTTAVALHDENSQQATSLPEVNATQEAHPSNTGSDQILSESKGSALNSSLTVPDVKPVNDIHQAMVVILVSTLSFGCVFLLVVVFVLGRRIYEGYQKRHYSRLDYLINGMYS